LPDPGRLPPYRITINADETTLSDDLRVLITAPEEIIRLKSNVGGGRFSLIDWMASVDPQAAVAARGADLILTRKDVGRGAQRISLLRLEDIDYQWHASGGKFITEGDRWHRFWQAPSRHGTYWLSLKVELQWSFAEYLEGPDGRRPLKEETFDDLAEIELPILVMVPASRKKEGLLFGYPIGFYPDPDSGVAPGGLDLFGGYYRAPEGYIEVGRRDARLELSEHFRLGDFLPPEPSGFPRYLVLQPRLLQLLERLADRCREASGSTGRLRVISGFRPPEYNRKLGMDPLSRHQYGDAADLIVDGSPDDWIMDDLDGDGEIDLGDAKLLQRWAVEVKEQLGITGGIGVYSWSADRRRGPFLHLDCRGYDTLWEGGDHGE
jgi:hypothetical protein